MSRLPLYGTPMVHKTLTAPKEMWDKIHAIADVRHSTASTIIRELIEKPLDKKYSEISAEENMGDI